MAKRGEYVARPCVYVITHIPTKRHYVGKSVDVKKRWHQHKYIAKRGDRSQYISRALNKYGVRSLKL